MMNNFFSRNRSARKARALRARLELYGFTAYSDVSDGAISVWGLHRADTDVDILMSMPEATPLSEGRRTIDRAMLRLVGVAISRPVRDDEGD